MDCAVLVSIINTKLRNDYKSLTILCEDLDISQSSLIEKLNNCGYRYNEDLNQFK